MPNSHRICKEMGITLHAKSHRHPGEIEPSTLKPIELPAKHTWSRRAILDIAVKGERNNRADHVYDVLTLMLSTEAHSTQMYGETLLGVSEWLIKQPIDDMSIQHVVESFKALDLSEIRSLVRHHRISRRPQQIALLIAGQMEEAIREICA